MPFKTVKDPETGEERQVYVAPAAKPQAQQKPAAKPQPQKPSVSLNELVGAFNPGELLTGQLQSAVGSIGAAAQELQRTGDVGKAFARGQQQYMTEVSKPGRVVARTAANAVVRAAQEASDTVRDVGALLGVGKGTTAKQPNMPLLGTGFTPAQAQSSGPIEDLATGVLQFGVELVGLNKFLKGAGLGIQAAKIPGTAAVAGKVAAVSKGVQALQKAPVRGVGALKGAEGIAKRTAGYYLEGAGKGAIIDFAGFDQYGGNVSDLVDGVVDHLAGTDLQLPVLEYLKSKPGDEGAKARLRNAVDGFAWGGPFGVAVGVGAPIVGRAMTKTFEFVKAAADEADVLKAVQNKTTQPAAEPIQAPVVGQPATAVDPVVMQARMQDAEMQVRRTQTLLDQLGPEPARPEVKEKSPRATAYRSWVRKNNQLQKELAAAQANLSSATIESGVSQAPVPARMTGKAKLQSPAPETVVIDPKPLTPEEATARRVQAEQELMDVWEEVQLETESLTAPDVPVVEAPAAAVAPQAATEVPMAPLEVTTAAPVAPVAPAAVKNISIYHGTSLEAAEKIKQAGFWNKFDVSLYGGGIYGTRDLGQAKRYATMKGGKAGKVLELSIDPSEIEDLGQFPAGNKEAIDKLYAKARSLRQEGKSVLIRGHDRYGDLVILDPGLATRSLTQEAQAKYKAETAAAQAAAPPEVAPVAAATDVEARIAALGPEPELPTPPQVVNGEVDPAARDAYEAQLRAYNDYYDQLDALQTEAAAVAPVRAAGPTDAEIQELDQALAVGRADLSPEQRVALRDQVLAERYAATAEGGGAGMPPEPPAEPPMEMGPLPDPDLEAVVNAATTNMEALKAGRITLEELMQNEVRRYISPSGETIYNPRTPAELAAFIRAISDEVVLPLTKAVVTDQPTLDFTDLHREAAKRMRADGFTGGSVDRLVGEAQDYIDANSDVASKVVLVRSLQLAIDHLGNEAAILALRWKNRTIADVGNAGQLAQQLVAAYEELSRVYAPYMTLGRQPAQEMRGRQMKNPFDGGLMALPKGIVLRHGTSRQAAEGILETGFKAGSKAGNLLGQGVYFTTNPMYTGAYGDTEIFGDLPEDVMILDLIEMGKSVNDVAKEIGIGSVKVTKVDGEPFHFMSGKQKDLFRAWVLDQGYDGVRYEATFSSPGVKGPGTVDEVVIYDVAKANRVVGSKAAIEQLPVDDANVPEILAKEMAADVENLMDKFPVKVQQEIAMGKLSEEAERTLDILADGIQAQKSAGKYAAGSFAQQIRKAPRNALTFDAITQLYISSLIWSDATWYAMLLGTSYKAATLPLVQASGYYWKTVTDLAKMDATAAVRDFRRANQQWLMYSDYQLRLGAAWKLTKMAFETGTPINSTMRGMSDYSAPKALANEQAAARLAGKDDSAAVALRENTLDNPFFLDPETNYLSPETFNPLAAAVRFVWKTNNYAQRFAASIDTLLSHIVAPAAEYRRFFVEEVERAESMGLKYGSQEALEFATKRAQARLEEISRDVYVNGEVVKNGVVTGTAAENVTNWLNYTDDVWISEQEMRLQRTYEGGLREAADRGITDPGDANDFAVAWANETPNIPRAGRVASVVPKLWENAVTMMPILRLQQAFNRTPANLVKSAARGMPGANFLVDTYWRDMQSENPDIRARASGELVVGGMLTGLLFSLAVAGNVQFAGAGPADPAQNRKWRTYLGLDTGPFSMRVKNPVTGQWYPWVSIQRLDQIGTIAGFVGDFIDLGNSMTIEDTNSLGGSLALATASMLFRTAKGQLDRTTYQGFRELVEGLQGLVMPLDMEGDRINPAVGMLENILAKLATPYGGATRMVKRVIDPRRTSVPASNFLQETFDRYRSQYPGQTSDLPGQLHPVTGNEQISAGIWGTQFIPPNMPWLKGAVAIVSPTSVFPYAESTNDVVDEQLAKLQGRGSRFDFWSPANSVDGYRLGYRERNDLVRIGTTIIPPGMDTTFHEALRRTIASQAYQDADDQRPSSQMESDRAVMINNVYQIYKKAALDAFLASPSGAEAKAAYDRLNQSRIDQRNRLGGVMANEQPMLQEGQGENSVQQFVRELLR